MLGVDRNTGQSLDGLAHLRQSILDLLTTRIGTRVMRREYGCGLWQFIDAPMNPRTFALMTERIAVALDLWEPRIKLLRCQITNSNDQGVLWLSMTAKLQVLKSKSVNPISINQDFSAINAQPASVSPFINKYSASSPSIQNNIVTQQNTFFIKNKYPSYIGAGSWALDDIPIQGSLGAYINGQRIDSYELKNNILKINFDFDPDEDVLVVDYALKIEDKSSDLGFRDNIISFEDIILN